MAIYVIMKKFGFFNAVTSSNNTILPTATIIQTSISVSIT